MVVWWLAHHTFDLKVDHLLHVSADVSSEKKLHPRVSLSTHSVATGQEMVRGNKTSSRIGKSEGVVP